MTFSPILPNLLQSPIQRRVADYHVDAAIPCQSGGKDAHHSDVERIFVQLDQLKKKRSNQYFTRQTESQKANKSSLLKKYEKKKKNFTVLYSTVVSTTQK